MFAQILTALGAIKEILGLAKSLVAFYNEVKTENWFQDWQESVSKLREAKTSDERKDAARRIRDALGGL